MANFTMRRIAYTAADAAEQLQQLCQQLSLQADVVSPRGRALTEQVFGAALTPAQVVERICSDVRRDGLAAVLRYTAAFDKAQLNLPRVGCQ
jgi:histidinol dehydrogenase